MIFGFFEQKQEEAAKPPSPSSATVTREEFDAVVASCRLQNFSLLAVSAQFDVLQKKLQLATEALRLVTDTNPLPANMQKARKKLAEIENMK